MQPAGAAQIVSRTTAPFKSTRLKPSPAALGIVGRQRATDRACCCYSPLFCRSIVTGFTPRFRLVVDLDFGHMLPHRVRRQGCYLCSYAAIRTASAHVSSRSASNSRAWARLWAAFLAGTERPRPYSFARSVISADRTRIEIHFHPGSQGQKRRFQEQFH